jgi:predicted CxxxxCH...CXXCH cytochrome family protein
MYLAIDEELRMKTCQSTGYFQRVHVRLLLCFISSVVFAGSACAYDNVGKHINACYDCHGSPIIPNGTDIRPLDDPRGFKNITTGAFVGSHQKHITSPTTASITCTPCHGVAPVSLNHRDGKLEMTLTAPGAYSKGTFFNQTSLPVLGTCSNIICHSATTTPALTTPTWGVSAGCAACHATSPTTGAHTTHMTAPISAVCGTCHAGATVGTSGGPGHGNNLIDVSLYSPTSIAKHTANVYTATCSTACHNAYSATPIATPSWGVSATCSSCHASTPVTGSHSKHVQHTNIGCDKCHAGAAAGVSGGSGHGNTTIDVAAGGYPTGRLKGSPFASCSNVGCHNDPATPAAFTAPAVTWGTALNCSGCHGYPGSPTNATIGSTHAVVAVGSCNSCHNNVTPGGTYLSSSFFDIQMHGNGIRDVSGGTACNGCHAYDAADWATTTTNYSLTAANEGVGAHAKHIAYIKTRWGITLNPTTDFTAGYGVGSAAAVCGVCHSNNAAVDHMLGGRNINFNGSVARQFGTNNNPTTWYTGVSTTSSAINQKKCSNLDCHYGTTPLWSTY